MSKQRIDPGEGYRLLSAGEAIQEGDEFQAPGSPERQPCVLSAFPAVEFACSFLAEVRGIGASAPEPGPVAVQDQSGEEFELTDAELRAWRESKGVVL